MNQVQSGTVQNRSRPVLAQWNNGQNTMKYNFAALYMYSWSIPCARNGQERFRTVPNGSERFLAHGICAHCWHVLTFSGFPVLRTVLPKKCQEHGTRMTCRKQRIRKTFIPTGTHAPWPPESKRKGSKQFDMLWHDRAPPERASACMQHARCQGASCALSGSVSQHLEHREWCEWPTEGLRNISTCFGFWASFFIFGRAMFMGC